MEMSRKLKAKLEELERAGAGEADERQKEKLQEQLKQSDGKCCTVM